MSSDPTPLAKMIAKRFIQRRDVLAEQTAMQGYRPVREGKDGPLVPVTQRALLAHLSGDKTYGHYLLDTDDKCRVFAFDIDLEKNSGPDDPEPHHVGRWAQPPDMETWTGSEDTWTSAHVIHEFDARESWRDRRHPSRTYLKTQMRYLAGMLARTIHEELELPTAVTYTGAKGIHVYGFTDPLPAEQVREAAQIVLDSLDCFRPSKGKHFFKHVNTDPIDGYDNFSIEVFPKQTSIGDGGFGNLMRLPLGVNRKAPKDPTFFVDLRAPMSELVAHPNPLAILESGNPWLD